MAPSMVFRKLLAQERNMILLMAFRCSEVPCKLLQYTGVVSGVGVTTRSTRGLPVGEAGRQGPEQLFPGTNPVPLRSGRNP